MCISAGGGIWEYIKKVCLKVRNQELIVQVMLLRNVKENKRTNRVEISYCWLMERGGEEGVDEDRGPLLL